MAQDAPGDWNRFFYKNDPCTGSAVPKVRTLQEVCIACIVMNLEQYSTPYLSLLPKKYREHLLCIIPVLDVCRLEEDSSFTAGIDMESVWKEVYRKVINNYDVSIIMFRLATKRELLFCTLFHSVIDGKNQPDKHVSHSYEKGIFLVISCGTFANILVVPQFYKTSRINQLVPPRYAKLFPEGSCYLPDSTALQLITEKCHYRPKKLHIFVPGFTKFLRNVEKQCDSVDWLKGCFQGIEYVSFEGNIDEDRGVCSVSYKDCEGVASRVLDMIIQSSKQTLTSLTVSSSIKDDVLESIMPISVRYGGFRHLSFRGYSFAPSKLPTLSSIIDHQLLLNSLEICNTNDVGYDSLYSDAYVCFESHLVPWIQTCFLHPSLEKVTFSVTPASLGFIMDVITKFFTTPCSHEQTLTFAMDLGEYPFGFAGTLRRFLLYHRDPSANQFDNSFGLKYKCLDINPSFCGLNKFFANALFELGPFKLKKMSFARINQPWFYSRLAQSSFIEMELLEMYYSDLPDKKATFFQYLSEKKFLKCVKCKVSNDFSASDLDDVTFEHFEKTLISDGGDGEKVFVFSRK